MLQNIIPSAIYYNTIRPLHYIYVFVRMHVQITLEVHPYSTNARICTAMYQVRTIIMGHFQLITFPLGRVTLGQRGLLASQRGILSGMVFSTYTHAHTHTHTHNISTTKTEGAWLTCPFQGLFSLCGETSTH